MISVIITGHDNTSVTIFAPPLESWDESKLNSLMLKLENEWRQTISNEDFEDVNEFATFLVDHGFMRTSDETFRYMMG